MDTWIELRFRGLAYVLESLCAIRYENPSVEGGKFPDLIRILEEKKRLWCQLFKIHLRIGSLSDVPLELSLVHE